METKVIDLSFPKIKDHYAYPVINKGRSLSGYFQKVFLDDWQSLNNKRIRSMKMYDTLNYGTSSINWAGKRITLFSIVESLSATLNILDDNENFILQNFPIQNLVNPAIPNNYQFDFRANFKNSFIVMNNPIIPWGTNTGWILEVYM